MKYIQETALPPRKRINFDQKAKSGQEYVKKSVRNDFCGVSFTIKVLEILPDACYKNNETGFLMSSDEDADGHLPVLLKGSPPYFPSII